MARKTKEQKNRARRVKYYNKKYKTNYNPWATGAEAAKQTREMKRNRERLRLLEKIRRYNERPHAAQNKIALTEKGLRGLSNKQFNEVKKIITPVLKAVHGQKTRSNKKAARELLELNKNKNKRTKLGSHARFFKESVSKQTEFIDNLGRDKIGEKVRYMDELYYHNFLKACARVGAWRLYRLAQKGGWPYVKKLYERGFEISDVYHDYYFNEDDAFGDYQMTDDEMESLIGRDGEDYHAFNAKKMKDSDYGDALYHRYETEWKKKKPWFIT